MTKTAESSVPGYCGGSCTDRPNRTKMLKPWFLKMLKGAEVPWDENPVFHPVRGHQSWWITK